MVRAIIAGALFAGSVLGSGITPGDARRGEEFFRSGECSRCHSFQGKGGNSAPDLAVPARRAYTPSVIASAMWNHAPQMWSAISSQGLAATELSPESAADLFAYLVSARYFEPPGDAARGRRVFSDRHCAACHGISKPVSGGGPPVAQWESLADPLLLAQQMWNHGARMQTALAGRKIAWVRLTSRDLTDMVAYLGSLPETSSVERTVQFPPAENGEKLFAAKGCAACHVGARTPENLIRNETLAGTSMWKRSRSQSLEERLADQTLTDIAVDMWDHLPRMKQPPPTLSPDEMRQIIAYIWARQYFTGEGNANAGKKVFAEKHCASCHEDAAASGAPRLARGKEGHSAVTMVAALWRHGPRMLESMKRKGLSWPGFTAREMSDLIAYLNSL